MLIKLNYHHRHHHHLTNIQTNFATSYYNYVHQPDFPCNYYLILNLSNLVKTLMLYLLLAY